MRKGESLTNVLNYYEENLVYLLFRFQILISQTTYLPQIGPFHVRFLIKGRL